MTGRLTRAVWPVRPARPDLALARGERLLAWAGTVETGGEAHAGTTGVTGAPAAVGGSRDALYFGDQRIAWEQVESADWEAETETLHVSEVGPDATIAATGRSEHRARLVEPARLLQLVRERVTASIVVQRHVPITARAGVRVVARRAPGRHGPLSWAFAYDEGIDPGDPVVRLAVEDALAAARADVGER